MTKSILIKIIGIVSLYLIIPIVSFTQEEEETDSITEYSISLYYEGKFDKAIDTLMFRLNLETSSSNPDNTIIADCQSLIGVMYSALLNNQDAIKWLNLSLENYKNLGDLSKISECYNNIGYIYKSMGRWDSCIIFYSKSLNLAEESGTELDIAITLNNIGSVYHDYGLYDSALVYYQRSLHIKQILGDTSNISSTLNNIALLYRDHKKYDRAIEKYQELLALDQVSGDEKGKALRLNNIGNTYVGMGKYDSASLYFQQALEIARETGYNKLIPDIYNNFGNVSLKLQDYDLALEYFLQALELYKETGIQEKIAPVQSNIADAYNHLGNYNLALTYLSQSLDLTRQNNLRIQTENNYYILSDVYENLGNYIQALQYYKKYSELKDSLFTEESRRELTKFEIFYESEKKDNQIRILKQKEEIQVEKSAKERIYRFSLIGGVILFMIIAITIYFSLNRRKKDNIIISNEKSKSDKLLKNILPVRIADDLKESGQTEPQLFKDVTVCFTDIVGFTEKSAKLEPKYLIDELNDMFTAFDNIIEKYHCERIKTIGDAYMAVCGLPVEDKKHAENILRSAVEMVQYLEKRNLEAKVEWTIRVGINSGEVMAGVVGVKKYIYDVFGDTVNTASRIECNSEPMKINVSESTYLLLKDKFRFEERGELDVKGKGIMKMYWLKT